MPPKPDAASPTGHHDAQPGIDNSAVVWASSGDFGHDVPQPGSTGHHDAQPGVDSGQDPNLPSGLPLPEQGTV